MGHDFEPLSARIIEAALAVHKALGPGFLESIYHAALRVALSRSGVPYENKKGVCIYFEGVEVGLINSTCSLMGRLSWSSKPSKPWRTCTSPR